MGGEHSHHCATPAPFGQDRALWGRERWLRLFFYKISIINPGLVLVFFAGLIFGGAYFRRGLILEGGEGVFLGGLSQFGGKIFFLGGGGLSFFLGGGRAYYRNFAVLHPTSPDAHLIWIMFHCIYVTKCLNTLSISDKIGNAKSLAVTRLLSAAVAKYCGAILCNYPLFLPFHVI